MPITAAVPNSAKLAALVALCPPGNTYKIALYTSAASLDATTTVYTVTGEVVGTGYTAGGKALSGHATSLDAGVAILDFANPATWTDSTITARGALIYDATDGDKVRAVLDFGADITSTAGPFDVTFPAPAAATALIKIA